MKAVGYVALSICCKKLNLIELDNITGLKHTSYHAIGDYSISGIELDYSEWYYKTKNIETYYTEEITDVLYENLKRCIDKLELFVNKNDCKVLISVVYTETGDVTPSLTLNRKIINMLERLKGTFEFD